MVDGTSDTQSAGRVFFQYLMRQDGSTCFPVAQSDSRNDLTDLLVLGKTDAAPFFAVVHPEDAGALRQSLQASAGQLSLWSQEFRFLHPAHGVRWVSGLARPEMLEDRSCLWSGYLADITSRKVADQALRDSEEFVRATLDASLSHICVLNRQGVIVAVNQAWRDFFRDNASNPIGGALLGENYLLACDCAVGDFSDEAPSVAAGIRSVIAGELSHFMLEYPCHSPTEQRWFILRVSRFKGPSANVVVAHENITERKLIELRERHRNQLLQMLADGAALKDLLTASVQDLERSDNRIICSILLLSNDGTRLLQGAAPSLPDFYNQAIDGMLIGPGAGSCGTAAFTKQRVIVEDIDTHPWWQPYRQMALRAGLRSCWSQPILSSLGEMLGTFAIYHRNVCAPSASDVAMIENEARLMALAIERSKAKAHLQLAASVFSHAREGIVITDASATIIEVNETFCRITGYSREEVIGHNPRMLRSGLHNAAFYEAMWESLIRKKHWYGELWNRRKTGEIFAELLTISAVEDAQGVTQNYVALFTDVTLMKEHEHELEHIAHYDVLTGLPNRALLADRLHQAIVHTQRSGGSLAVVFLDLDGFKRINDVYGHGIGDQLLIALSHRMKSSLREGDTLARIGGDEFVAVLVDLERFLDCQPILDRLLQAAASPVTLGDVTVSVSASLGVTIYPQDGGDGDMLIRHADQAMYVAKQAGKNRFHLFDVERDAAVKDLQDELNDIERALQNGEFVLHYQPKVQMRTGELLGVEALVRWQHPQRGLLQPGEFLPRILDSPLIVALGDFVLHLALTQIELWAQQGLQVAVSVNLSARQLQQEGFVSHLERLFQAHPTVPFARIEFEMLESSAVNDMALAQQVMQGCVQLGIRFSLDDFGTGYSSLTYLKVLPAEVIKIDQSFVRSMLQDASDKAIVQGVIGLAHAFHRKVVAEGVETESVGNLLLELGCDVAQGYGIARPMPADALTNWLSTWKPFASWRNSVKTDVQAVDSAGAATKNIAL